MKQQSEWMRDITDPGWREREADMVKKFSEAIPLRNQCESHEPVTGKPIADDAQKRNDDLWRLGRSVGK